MFNPFEKTGEISQDLPALLATIEAFSDSNLTATLANASALLGWYYERINWVGFYLWSDSDDELVLGPFQGLPACIRIRKGRGVCGTAVETGEIQLVKDVHAFPGHIACDSASRSELVVPISTGSGELLGVLDIDSPETDRFTNEDAGAMDQFCTVLSSLLSTAS